MTPNHLSGILNLSKNKFLLLELARIPKANVQYIWRDGGNEIEFSRKIALSVSINELA